jgi:hypothetical protein
MESAGGRLSRPPGGQLAPHLEPDWQVHETRESIMLDHTYRVRLTIQTVQHVIASTVQIHGDHLIFMNAKGQLAALFLKDLVRSWNMLPNTVPHDTALRRCSGTEAIP